LTTPRLSLIIPAFNEESRLPRTLGQASSFLNGQSWASEILVVENGSTDRTFEIAQDFAHQHDSIRVLRAAQRGKGSAVRHGMLAARGEYRFICDADLSMPIEEVSKFLPPELDDFDVAIGSRESVGAVRYNEPPYRHWGGRLLNYAIRALILPGLKDTQCGFKCFRGAVADDLFREQTLVGWSFDIELLFLARRRGYRLREVPINWYFSPESKVSAVPDALRILTDIFRIHANALRGRYDHASPS
jgi:glycosyltransferase involved in cell wall biosynthesis